MSTSRSDLAAPSIDLDAIREKYRQERDRRIRADGEAQFVEATGELARYESEDPYAPPGFERAPLNDEIEVAIIGGGWSGLFSAARLSEAGIENIRIIEAGSDFGGAWYWNRYPGAQCDIESYCYFPLLEETGYIPKEKYSYAPEIFEHAKRIGLHYDLYRLACFQTRVTGMTWDEDLARWRITTNRGDDIKARYVLTAVGPVNRPKLPGLPGMQDFKGHTFHTCRWDYNYTGGSHAGGLTKLADKRVAVIGTGATAIQSIPHVAASAKHLYVFQRTPSSVDFRGNKPTDPEWVKSLKPGWQRERQQNFDDVVMGRPFKVDLVSDSWTDIFRRLQSLFWDSKTTEVFAEEAARKAEDAATLGEMADAQKMEEVRARVDQVVKDPKTAEALKPWYRQFCKRPTFNDEYLEAFNRPNVTLVDTSGSHGVERITENGLVANGVEYEVDCIIFATGFQTTTSFKNRIGIPIHGRGGESLYDHWAKGMRTFHGYSVHGFPNWFFVGGITQNGMSFNFASTTGEQAKHIAFLINAAKERQATRIEPTAEAEAEWVAEIHRLAYTNKDFMATCTPGYFNNEGQFDKVASNFFAETYTPGANAFNALVAAWRDQGDLKGLTFS